MSIADQIDAAVGKANGVFGREMSRFGLTLAKVTNITDSEKLNRVKCLPIGGKDGEETDWCYVMSPMGGKECGLFLFPQVDDLVVLGYIDEDPHRPVVLGSYWTTETRPPYTVQDGKAQDYGFKTPKKIDLAVHDEDKKQKVTLTLPSGPVLTLDNEDKKQKVTLSLPSGAVLSIDDGAKSVSLKDKSGNNALTMDLQGGNVSLKAKSKLTLSAGSTTITLESGGNITGKGNGTVSIKGTNVEAKANTSIKLEGSAMAVLKGGIVKIN